MIVAAVVPAHLLPEETEPDLEPCPHPSIYAILVGPGLLPGEDSPRRIVTVAGPGHLSDETSLNLELRPVPSLDAMSAAPGLLQGEDFLRRIVNAVVLGHLLGGTLLDPELHPAPGDVITGVPDLLQVVKLLHPVLH